MCLSTSLSGSAIPIAYNTSRPGPPSWRTADLPVPPQCLHPLPIPGSCPQLKWAWRKFPGLGPMARWQPTYTSGI